uniref:Uncharacterized protein n=1 Tax=Paramormyrops kingsleyae TaxID=1676925 RepID=A0A3B3R8Y2_9TELE
MCQLIGAAVLRVDSVAMVTTSKMEQSSLERLNNLRQGASKCHLSDPSTQGFSFWPSVLNTLLLVTTSLYPESHAVQLFIAERSPGRADSQGGRIPREGAKGIPREGAEGSPGRALKGSPGRVLKGSPGRVLRDPQGGRKRDPQGVEGAEGSPGRALKGSPGRALKGSPRRALRDPQEGSRSSHDIPAYLKYVSFCTAEKC